MMKRKVVYIRIRKKARNRFLVEERHTFMFFWRFYVKGSIRLRLPKYYASPKLAERAINLACEKRGYRPFIVML